jgi:hypothetical protein
VDRYYKDPDRYFECTDDSNKNNDNGGNNTKPALPLLISLPPALPLLLPLLSSSPLGSGIQTGSSSTIEKNYCLKEEGDFSDEYFENTKITRVSQQISNESINSTESSCHTSNKLFDEPQSNNFLYLEQTKEQNILSGLPPKEEGQQQRLQYMISNDSNIKQNSNRDEFDKQAEAINRKTMILKEYPDIPKDTLGNAFITGRRENTKS